MNFIEKYDIALSQEQCNYIISLFNDSTSLEPGVTSSGLDPSKKISTSLPLQFEERGNITSTNHIINQTIHPSLIEGVERYKAKYHLLSETSEWNLTKGYHVQRFQEGEGYFSTHCEHSSSEPYRMLVWMFYLNNARCGTRFYHQNITMKPRTGRLVIWPAGWTHMHSGVIPNKGDKYIITGWFSFLNN